MASWKFWDWVACTGIFVAAVIVAADAAIKNAPTLSPHLPDWIGGQYWSFAPLILITLSGVILLGKVIRVRLASSGLEKTSSTQHNTQNIPVPSQPSAEYFVPQDIYYRHEATAPGYPHKLWIVLSESRREFVLNPANWETNAGDLATRPMSKHPWTPEGPGGWQNNSWSWPRPERELEPIHVTRGQVLQTYVGLPGPLDDTELRRRIVSKRLGALIIPITINGHAASQTIKL